ncbi:MAG: uroporphyrinogen decarboxylase [Gammaproteobacteria bacterium]
MKLINDRLLKALRRQPVDATPVWIMRQAGRYLPEYRQVRSQVKNFMQLCKTPELACQVTLQPLARFDLDAAILFSDILVIPDAMGAAVEFQENIGPRINQPIRSLADVEQLHSPDPTEALAYVLETIEMTQHELAGKVPLIGFAGSPWTLACYMVEGGGSKDFATIKHMLYSEPEILHQLLQKLTRTVSDYLQAQIKAGVHAIMLFDTWGGVLTCRDYQQFSLDYMSQIIATIKQASDIPCILFTKNSTPWLEMIAQSDCDAISLDWTIDIGAARKRIGEQVSLQGNMDPMVLTGSDERIRNEVATILASYGQGSGHIFNLGHGITPQINPEKVAVMVKAVHELSAPYHEINL